MEEKEIPVQKHQEQNPLSGYFRKPEVYISLPSHGKYYPPGTLDMPANGEIGVFPMTARDELLFKTPDALLNGSSTVEVIQSCVPAIKDAWAMPSLDMDVVLIAIRQATYGMQMDMGSTCPQCGSKNEYGIDLGNLIDQSQNWKFVNNVPIDDLTFEFKPLNYKEMNVENLRQFEEQKILRIVNDENTNDEQKQELFNDAFLKLTAHTVNLIGKVVKRILMPDGTVVSSQEHIQEFLNNANRKTFDAIQKHLDEQRIANSFQEFELECENQECKHKYKTPIVFDNASFFA